MQVVILAGGLATRLGARTRELPKALLPVLGRPFLAWQVEALASSGFSDFVLCISHFGHMVRDFLGGGAAFGVTVAYSEDGPRLLGTGGALRNAAPLLAPQFLVTYGDSYLPFDYSAPLRDLESCPEALGTMSVFENAGEWDASNSEVHGDWVTRYEKGGRDPALRYIDYGAIALRRELLLEYPPDSAFGLDQLQSELARRGKLRAYVARERFYEIGSERGIEDLEAKLATR
ncbi:MAG TPA: sugar phosphate nucleotidyltransferase [Polyangiaceae bacterium]|jgi:NDP-sugar pyrophosphorylase family protein|nr:sugar phosphate nucleotidyltransferase [Polyangiaceae bacterium]